MEGTFSGTVAAANAGIRVDDKISVMLDCQRIIKIIAILDKRVGKRTLHKIKEAEEYKHYPEWVGQFYELRLKGSD